MPATCLVFWGMNWFNEIWNGLVFHFTQYAPVWGAPGHTAYLNQANALTWDYPWWSASAPWLIFLIGYLPFFLVSFWVFDMLSLQQKVKVVGTILAFDVVCLVVFAGILGWI